MLHSPITTLLVAVASDTASVSLRGHLLNKVLWSSVELPSKVDAACEVHQINNAWLLYFNEAEMRMTNLDDIDKKFENWFGVKPSDVVFLSRHTAASALPALCVHPIGVAADAEASHGGRSGVMVPPSSYIAPLYRELRKRAKILSLQCDATGSAFQTCLEATHHGPVLSTPSCFVEIGSSDLQYDQNQPAYLWAEILNDLIINPQDKKFSSHWTHFAQDVQQDKTIIVVLGGGHYMPKIGDLCAADDSVFLGHMLASYNFKNIESTSADNYEPPAWHQTIRAAIDATRQSYPGVDVVIRLEKKAFRSAARTEIFNFVSQNLGLEPIFF
uniref:D-aminoacyl-tRNA deacylase n=1 Tax=Aureoumbra lagunensis TaxID=44058 RepID=A0A7S3JYW6_9STRA